MELLYRLKRSIEKKKRKKAKILYNVFDSQFQKRVLLSYIKKAFEDDVSQDHGHTNVQTTLCIAICLNDLGYNVDIIDWQTNYEGDFYKYDLVIGLGPTLEKVLLNRNKGDFPRVIYFGTGCNPSFSNKVTLDRFADFYYKKRKALLSSSRFFFGGWPLQHEIADWIILHGDKFAKSTYRSFNIDTVLAPVFFYHTINRSDEDWIFSKSEYLWFGSTGAIHKGLDILINTFKQLPQYIFHICGNLEAEHDFFEVYKHEIQNCENITYHGFVDIKSETFKAILKKCAFVILPSASEANCASVITCMANGGLIPIVTKNADINIDNYGVEIFGFSEADIKDAIQRSQELNLNDLKEQNKRILLQTSKYHSFDYFRNDFKNKLNQALENLSKLNS